MVIENNSQNKTDKETIKQLKWELTSKDEEIAGFQAKVTVSNNSLKDEVVGQLTEELAERDI